MELPNKSKKYQTSHTKNKMKEKRACRARGMALRNKLSV